MGHEVALHAELGQSLSASGSPQWAAAERGDGQGPELSRHVIRVPIEIPQSEILKLFPAGQRAELERKREVLSTIAFFIGKDFKMPVKLGMPGGGWYWDESNNEIRVDPQDLLRMSHDACRFIVGHEGGHRRISRADIISERLLNTPGYMLLANIIEDPRVNNFVVDAYPTFQRALEASYFESARIRMSEEAERTCGGVPRILQAGFLLLKHWFEESTGKKLPEEKVPEEIRKVVEKVLPAARRAWSIYPSRLEAEQGEEAILRYCRASNAIVERSIWPHFKEIVAEDVRDQLLQELFQRINAQTGGKGIPLKARGQPGKTGKGGEAEESGGAADKKELLRRILENSRKAAESSRPGGAAGKKGKVQADEGAGEGEGQGGGEGKQGIFGKLSQLFSGILRGGQIVHKGEDQSASVPLMEQLRSMIEAGAPSAGSGPADLGELMKALKENLSLADVGQINSALRQARETTEMREMTQEIFGGKGEGKRDNSDTPPKQETPMAAIPLEAISPDLRTRLEAVLKAFAPKESERLIGKAFSRLKEFECKASAEFAVKTGEIDLGDLQYQKSDPNFTFGGGTPDPSRAGEFMAGSGKGNINLDYPEWGGEREGFIRGHRRLPENERYYHATRDQVISIINRLEIELREIFRERKARRWEDGKRHGPAFNLRRRIREIARQVPAVATAAFRKRERPTEKDYAITLLIDLSGSMRGIKIDETFKAAIILAEVLGRLSIKTEILGFNSYLYEYKPFHVRMSETVRGKMGGMSDETCRSPAQYNDDGWALAEASRRLARQKAQEKFLMVLSDGCPAPSGPHRGPEYYLPKIIKEVRELTDQKLVGLGIGPDTHHVEAFYPNHLADIRVEGIPKQFAKFLKEVIEDYERLKR